MKRKALVLSSGGIDSTTCIAYAIQNLGIENVSTVSISYGQKHSKELECAEKIAKYYGLKHYIIDLSEVFKHNSTCTLLKGNGDIKEISYEEQLKEKPIVDTYVPFRNPLMISAVTSLALSINPSDKTFVVLGNHAEDYGKGKVAVYPDCSPEFSESMAETVRLGSGGFVELLCPFVNSTKSDIVKFGLSCDVPYYLTWSCYEGKDKPCGKCGTCIDAIKAFKDNGKDYLEMYRKEETC